MKNCPYCGSKLKKVKDVFYCLKCKLEIVKNNEKKNEDEEDEFDFIEEVLDEEDEKDLFDLF